MANPKIRADHLLVAQGLAPTPEAAKRLIMAGRVRIAEKGRLIPLDKPGSMVGASVRLSLTEGQRFVSRGAYKLLTAIEHFHLDVSGLVALDVGASTGGFTDCLLQHGAARVYAVDVGKCQLHEKLRADPRVVALEGVNFRLAGPELLPEAVSMAVVDVSFISLTRVLGPVLAFLQPGGLVVALVKPQFELGPERAVRGVVREEVARLEAVESVRAFAHDRLRLTCQGVVAAAVKGPKGNQEYLVLFAAPQGADGAAVPHL